MSEISQLSLDIEETWRCVEITESEYIVVSKNFNINEFITLQFIKLIIETILIYTKKWYA